MIKEQSEVEVNLNVCIFTCVMFIDLVDTGLFNDKTQCSCYEIKGLGLLKQRNIWKIYMMMIFIRTLVLIIFLTFLHYTFEN